MDRLASIPAENKRIAAANSLPKRRSKGAAAIQLAGKRPVVDGQSQLPAIASPLTNNQAPIQRFKINQYDDYNGYLAGEDTIRSTERVKEMIGILKRGGKLSNEEPIKASKNVEMVKETRGGMPWQYIAKEEYDGEESEGDEQERDEEEGDEEEGEKEPKEKAKEKPKIYKKHVLVDGHHRFVAYVETGAKLPAIENAPGEGLYGYSWRTMGGMDEEYVEPGSSLKESAAAGPSGKKDLDDIKKKGK